MPKGCVRQRSDPGRKYLYDFRSSSRFRQLGRTFTRKPQNAMLTKRKYNVLRGNIGEEKRKVGVPARVEWRIVLSTDGRLRPAAAKQAGIQKQIDWHRLRQRYGTLVKSQRRDHTGAHATHKRQYHDGQVRPSRDASEARCPGADCAFDSVPKPLTETAVTG